ncbi:MAG: dihydrofolate reductase [Bacteroidales bacterium]|nr:dihydrofolate reductase [Bacteroidales bacterium]
MLSLIVAVAENWAIGRKNALLWHLPTDLKYFKKVTTGHTVIMGLNTYRSIGSKPLPNRRNIIVDNSRPSGVYDTLEYFDNLEEALKAGQEGGQEAIVMGGGMLYRTSLPYMDKLYITHVHRSVEDADTFFPEIDLNVWRQDWASERMKDEESGIEFTFTTYIRK